MRTPQTIRKVWVSRGFDADAVLKCHHSNRRPDPQFGELFRIYISSDGMSGGRTVATKDTVSGSAGGVSGCGASSSGGQLAIEDGDADSASSYSSSSSSRSRRRRRSSKKSKKAKKDKKHKKSKKAKKRRGEPHED